MMRKTSQPSPAGTVTISPRGLLLAASAAALSIALLWAAPATAGRIAAGRTVVELMAPHRALRAPRPDAPKLATLAAHTPLIGERTTLPVIGRTTDPRGAIWLKVLLPGRPDGASGWISTNRIFLATTPWHLFVDLRARKVRVYRRGHLVRTFAAVVGKRSTPTPTGPYFVEETLRLPASEPGGPFALALSARSRVLRHFEGGPGQIAIHGRMGLGGRLGTATSHGCIRLARRSIAWLARRIGPGVPVSIEGR